MIKEILIIGGGLAGCEAEYCAAKMGVKATVFEMKPVRFSPAHGLSTLGELVCSNSLKSESLENAAGLLKEEMKSLDSIIIKAAYATRVPAGKTLAVDRAAFSGYITDALKDAGVKIIRGEIKSIPDLRPLVIATGPLTSDALAETINGLYKAELIHRRAPWKTREAVELATLEWVTWFNHHRLLEPIGYIPPAEAEAKYYEQFTEQAMSV